MQGISSERSLKTKNGFFARQIDSNPTHTQRMFDLGLGILGPIVCFAADPIVFRGGVFGAPLFGEYQLLAYLISAVEVALLLVWLLLGRQMTAMSAPVGGALIGGSIFSALIGLAVLPYSLIGILWFIGFAGFTPFLTSFIYLRNGVRALRSQEENATYQIRFPVAVVGLVFALGLPYLTSIQVNRMFSSAVSDILNGNEAQASAAMKTLKPWAIFSEAQLQPLVVAIINSENDRPRQELLRKRYLEITGHDAVSRFND